MDNSCRDSKILRLSHHVEDFPCDEPEERRRLNELLKIEQAIEPAFVEARSKLPDSELQIAFRISNEAFFGPLRPPVAMGSRISRHRPQARRPEGLPLWLRQHRAAPASSYSKSPQLSQLEISGKRQLASFVGQAVRTSAIACRRRRRCDSDPSSGSRHTFESDFTLLM